MAWTRWVLGLAAIAASGLGCGDDEVAEQAANASESDIQTSFNGEHRLLGSYDELFDRSTGTACIRYEDQNLHARVSEPSRDLSIELIRKKEELAQKLGIDLKMQARYAVASGNAAVNLLHEFSSSTNAVSYLLSARADYVVRDDVRDGQNLELSEAGLEALEAGPATFVARCGTHYAKGVRYGARFYLLITYQALSHGSKAKMDATLGLDGGVVGSGDIQTRLERAASVEGVNVTIHAASNGFRLNTEQSQEVVKAMESLTVDDQLFSAATDLYFGMVQAVETDYCLDAGEGTCGGKPSPGYFHRNLRDTAVTGVQLGSYHSLQNAGYTGNQNPFAVIKERVSTHRQFIRTWSELDVRMDSIYNDEVRPFLDAPSKYKALFNIAPPGTPRRTPDEVYAVASDLEGMLDPPLGGVMGTLRRKIHDRIVACADTINVDITASCTANDSAVGSEAAIGELQVTETKAYHDVLRFFDDYHQGMRILPLHAAVGKWAVDYDDAQDHCDRIAEDLNGELGEIGTHEPVIYRLALGNEVRSVAPVLSHGNISWSDADITHATWYTPIDGLKPCGKDFPYFKNEPGNGVASLGCSVNDFWDDVLVPVCVPASGPVPLIPPQ
ncbi:MAG: hypothetical protein R3B72_47045 [Polyangiaceae bacterium]